METLICFIYTKTRDQNKLLWKINLVEYMKQINLF